MDQLIHYRDAIETIFREHAFPPSHGDVRAEIVVDAAKNHYELIFIGWDGPRRVHGSVLHVDLVGNKIWIQHDGTSPGIAHELVEAGVPRENIVLGFRPPHIRQYTGYAVD